MKSLNILRIPVTMMIVVLTLLSATPVYADGPVKNVNMIDSFTIYPGTDNACGFDVSVRIIGQTKTTTWYNAAGNPIKSIETLAGPLNFIWDAGFGKTLKGLVQGPIQITYLSPTERIWSVHGPSGFTIVPGYGPALYSTGNLTVKQVYISSEWVDVEVLKNVGIFAASPADVAAACAYIGP